MVYISNVMIRIFVFIKKILLKYKIVCNKCYTKYNRLTVSGKHYLSTFYVSLL